MTDTLDLAPAATHMADLVRGVADDSLGSPTPCPDYTVGDLIDHIRGFTVAFAFVARKETPPGGDQGASGDASRLGDDWRERIPADLDALVEAWRRPEAWKGMAKGGGMELPGEVWGVVTLDELVLHSWDLARATGQPYEADDRDLAAVEPFVSQFSGPGQEAGREGPFGPEVAVPAEAPLLDRILGMAGRDPGWASA